MWTNVKITQVSLKLAETLEDCQNKPVRAEAYIANVMKTLKWEKMKDHW